MAKIDWRRLDRFSWATKPCWSSVTWGKGGQGKADLPCTIRHRFAPLSHKFMHCRTPTTLGTMFCRVDMKCSSEKLEHISRICCPTTLLFLLLFLSSSSTNITWSYMSSWKPVGGRCPWYTNSEKALHVAVVLSVREQTQVNGEHPAGIAQAREGRPQLRFLWTQRTLRPLRTSPRNTSLRRSMKFMKHIETRQVDPFQWSFAFFIKPRPSLSKSLSLGTWTGPSTPDIGRP